MPKQPTEKWEKEFDKLVMEKGEYKFVSKPILKSFIAKTLQEERDRLDKVIQARLDYCQKQNGLPYCKNCGLSEEDLAQNKIK